MKLHEHVSVHFSQDQQATPKENEIVFNRDPGTDIPIASAFIGKLVAVSWKSMCDVVLQLLVLWIIACYLF